MVHFEYSIESPLNREPKVDELVSSFITKDPYDRNHGPIPHLDASTHHISINGLVKQDLRLSVADLHALPQHTLTCALQCAGNRRHTMRTRLAEVSGIDWLDGAVMNCRWRGPYLRDVLAKAGIRDTSDAKGEQGSGNDLHVAFSCNQTATQDDSFYGASLPLRTALDPTRQILLALHMNGAPLTPAHGAPVRVVTPGIAGARSVKWLDRITVQAGESENHYQQRDYKVLPPEADSKEKAEEWWEKVGALMEMPVNSVVGVPREGTTVERDAEGRVEVRGYAVPGGDGGPVVKVEVGVEGSGIWEEAELVREEDDDEGEGRWAWCLWKARIRVEKGEDVRILSRATDRAGHTQEEDPKWNLRGVAYNGYGEASGLTIV